MTKTRYEIVMADSEQGQAVKKYLEQLDDDFKKAQEGFWKKYEDDYAAMQKNFETTDARQKKWQLKMEKANKAHHRLVEKFLGVMVKALNK